MFVSLIAEIEVERAVSIPVTHGEAMQAEMLRHISRLNPAAAAELHGPAGGTMRPYTVSLLRPGPGGINNGRLQYEAGDHTWFRLTGMGPLPYAALSTVSENVDSWRLETFHAEFRIRRWCASPQDHSWAGIADLDELLNSAEQALLAEPHRAVLVFHSPTTFNSTRNGGGTGCRFRFRTSCSEICASMRLRSYRWKLWSRTILKRSSSGILRWDNLQISRHTEENAVPDLQADANSCSTGSYPIARSCGFTCSPMRPFIPASEEQRLRARAR